MTFPNVTIQKIDHHWHILYPIVEGPNKGMHGVAAPGFRLKGEAQRKGRLVAATLEIPFVDRTSPWKEYETLDNKRGRFDLDLAEVFIASPEGPLLSRDAGSEYQRLYLTAEDRWVFEEFRMDSHKYQCCQIPTLAARRWMRLAGFMLSHWLGEHIVNLLNGADNEDA